MESDEMIQGYMDGLNMDNPEPSANRSHSYRHGFANARADKTHTHIGSAETRRREAETAIEMDARS